MRGPGNRTRYSCETVYRGDLDPQVYERARAIAVAAGVKEGAFLDAAILDVAVIGDAKAAQAFVGGMPPSVSEKLPPLIPRSDQNA